MTLSDWKRTKRSTKGWGPWVLCPLGRTVLHPKGAASLPVSKDSLLKHPGTKRRPMPLRTERPLNSTIFRRCLKGIQSRIGYTSSSLGSLCSGIYWSSSCSSCTSSRLALIRTSTSVSWPRRRGSHSFTRPRRRDWRSWMILRRSMWLSSTARLFYLVQLRTCCSTSMWSRPSGRSGETQSNQLISKTTRSSQSSLWFSFSLAYSN